MNIPESSLNCFFSFSPAFSQTVYRMDLRFLTKFNISLVSQMANICLIKMVQAQRCPLYQKKELKGLCFSYYTRKPIT
uniref:Heterogeneous nuclear ribonucleoprotein R n=1 Tax=Rhizophora mucronata TaxID=61149 RepID=A0A2P2PLJ9_RHIMU